ncbi:hypothetical protein J6590_100237 [Homalodisca vitripennis]|nr:hypothetical protein J6590_100237 [Homalodisca vitripennis]
MTTSMLSVTSYPQACADDGVLWAHLLTPLLRSSALGKLRIHEVIPASEISVRSIAYLRTLNQTHTQTRFLGNFTKATTLVGGRVAVHDEVGRISSPEPANAGYGPALKKGHSYHTITQHDVVR